jgi:hypothetical protein
LINLLRVHARVVPLDPTLHLVQIISPPDHPFLAHLLFDGQFLESLRITAFVPRILLLKHLVLFLKLNQLLKHTVSLAIKRQAQVLLCSDLRLALLQLDLHVLSMLRYVVDKILSRLKTLARECPEKGTATYSISLNEVVIY